MEDKIREIERRIERDENTCQQLLGKFLVDVAVLNALELVIKLIVRAVLEGQTLLISGYETYVGVVRMVLVIVAFIYCFSRMKKLYFHSPNSNKLLFLWGVILIPIQLINDIISMLYTRMLELIQHVLVTSGVDSDGQIFALIYDSTHGFKYICIFLAILLGIVMTGELLEKKSLIIFTGVVAILFMIAFAAFKMKSFSLESILSFEIGINWTSLIFHALTTIGLFSIGMYIVDAFKREKKAIAESETATENEEK